MGENIIMEWYLEHSLVRAFSNEDDLEGLKFNPPENGKQL